MLRAVALDSGPLGLLTHPKPNEVSVVCFEWLKSIPEEITILLPEIADYELRREYLLRNNVRSVNKLVNLRNIAEFLPLNSTALEHEAELWAQSRSSGQPLSHPKALDADCILIAQVKLVAQENGWTDDDWVIATVDMGDLPRLAPARIWQNIKVPLFP